MAYDPIRDQLADAAEAIAAGGVVAYPTETFYALGADPGQSEALDRLLRLKGRGAEDKPLLLLIASLDDLGDWVSEFPPAFDRLVAHFWPGPMTMVLPPRAGLPSALTGSGGIAVRLTSHPVARGLIRACGTALPGTSANRTGEPPCADAAAVRAAFGDQLTVVVDGGPTAAGEPSTLLDLSGEKPRILRPGAIDVAAIQRVVRLV
ncbi:MAG: threonylcarbamoyl-AMP synthase [Acidobacteria bacterium]|nr:threonylcarbamoyl-AMP synthase [Acidobacteriota bacterium]